MYRVKAGPRSDQLVDFGDKTAEEALRMAETSKKTGLIVEVYGKLGKKIGIAKLRKEARRTQTEQ